MPKLKTRKAAKKKRYREKNNKQYLKKKTFKNNILEKKS